ncbi:unnamed protein product [Caenorhabditis bovis]|uniref:Innexin n=1 Tax=Caenorhabditis bovis TaxID=2654633 RepID=A0A8S1EC11_9PELO|nr:unnamed protein product [Caenorhabditis bovis]
MSVISTIQKILPFTIIESLIDLTNWTVTPFFLLLCLYFAIDKLIHANPIYCDLEGLVNVFFCYYPKIVPHQYLTEYDIDKKRLYWVPMFIAIQIVFIITPRVCWQIAQRYLPLSPKKFCSDARKAKSLPDDENTTKIEEMANQFVDCLHSQKPKNRNSLIIAYFLFKMSNLLMAFFQFFVVAFMLSTEYNIMDSVESVINLVSPVQMNHTLLHLRSIRCRFQIPGTMQPAIRPIYCFLAINNFDDSIFKLILVWLIFDIFFTLCDLSCATLHIGNHYNMEVYVRSFDSEVSSEKITEFKNYLRADGLQLLSFVIDQDETVASQLTIAVFKIFLNENYQLETAKPRGEVVTFENGEHVEMGEIEMLI